MIMIMWYQSKMNATKQGGRHGRDYMVIGSTTTYAISAYHQCCKFELRSGEVYFDTTLCDKVCQWLAASWWFFTVSFTNETDRHDITEILLKVALNTITIPFHQTSHKAYLDLVISRAKWTTQSKCWSCDIKNKMNATKHMVIFLIEVWCCIYKSERLTNFVLSRCKILIKRIVSVNMTDLTSRQQSLVTIKSAFIWQIYYHSNSMVISEHHVT